MTLRALLLALLLAPFAAAHAFEPREGEADVACLYVVTGPVASWECEDDVVTFATQGSSGSYHARVAWEPGPAGSAWNPAWICLETRRDVDLPTGGAPTLGVHSYCLDGVGEAELMIPADPDDDIVRLRFSPNGRYHDLLPGLTTGPETTFRFRLWHLDG